MKLLRAPGWPWLLPEGEAGLTLQGKFCASPLTWCIPLLPPSSLQLKWTEWGATGPCWGPSCGLTLGHSLAGWLGCSKAIRGCWCR